jgi:glutamate 5-kinase
MLSKLRAAQMATMAGENVIIASGHREGILRQIMDGQLVGTVFLAQGKSISPWKRWIGFSAQPRGALMVDQGARQAIERNGRSLLPIGILRIEGGFAKGDVVALLDDQRNEFARGLCNYSAGDVQRIAGQQSDRIADILGHSPYTEVMHRDNIALTR